jgi:3-oxoacyl-[acyl-carrier-protein] synthase II
LLGAAGAVEAVFAALALRDQIVPPTLHLTNPDPACDLDYVPNVARKDVLVSSLSLSYGFGGQMGGVYFTRSDM